MTCWTVSYYFCKARCRRLLRGEFCGCIEVETRQQAIASVSPVEMDADHVLVKVTARRMKAGHICTGSRE